MKKVLRFIHPLLVLTLALLLASSACGGKQTTSGTPVYLGELQKNGNISVRFFGLMTFNGLGATVSLPAELAIPSLSITWMGHIFTGGGDDVGAGEEITYQVHGTASQDGLWLDTLSYSRQVIWKGKNSGTFYRVTMTNVPIATMSGGKPVGQGTCKYKRAQLAEVYNQDRVCRRPCNQRDYQGGHGCMFPQTGIRRFQVGSPRWC